MATLFLPALISIGHAAYFGLGAYAGGFLYTLLDVDALEAYLLAGMVAAGVTAAISGALCVRATRVHFTILTLAVAQIGLHLRHRVPGGRRRRPRAHA